MIMLFFSLLRRSVSEKKNGGNHTIYNMEVNCWEGSAWYRAASTYTHHPRERVKHIHFPQWVIPGSVRTHDYDPFHGFKR